MQSARLTFIHSCDILNPMDEKKLIEALKRYLPARVVEKIMLNPEKATVEGERKFVTILFGDLSGFTSLSEKLEDPEKVVEVVNRYFTRMLEIVEKYGGDVDKFLGDAIMVVFGAPVAHGNDPERACRAALEMVKAIKEFGFVETPKGPVEINMSIGVNTGEVVALNVGSEKRMEYTVMGDNVNLASRLEGVARAGEVIISDSTYRYVKDIFEVEKLEPVKVKGKEKPIQIYKLTGLKEERKKEKIFAGRERELEELKRIFEKERIVWITGREGIGKTTLVDRFLEPLRGYRIFHISGSPYASFESFHPFIEWYERERGKKPENVEKEVIEFVREAEKSLPPVFRIEDLHTFDPASFDLLMKIMDEFPGAKFIIESEKKEGEGKEVSLPPFSRKEAEEFLKRLWNARSVEPDVVERCLLSTEGIPLYIKEFAQSVDERGLIYRVKGRIRAKKEFFEFAPEGVGALITAMLDSLPEEEKVFLQHASMFQGPFSLSLFSRIFSMDVEKAEGIAERLERKGLLIRRGETLMFSSIALRDAAYSTVLRKKKKEIHPLIAREFEKEEAPLSLIALQYELGGKKEKAKEFYLRAGEEAVNRGGMKTAKGIYERLMKLTEKEKGKRRWKVLLRYARVLSSLGMDRESEKIGKSALKLTEENTPEKGSTLTLLGRINFKLGRFEKAEKYWKTALKIFKSLENKQDTCTVLENLATLYVRTGKLKEAEEYYQEALDTALESGLPDVAAHVYMFLHEIKVAQGDMESALFMLEKAEDLGIKMDDREFLAALYTSWGGLLADLGNLEEAEEKSYKALKILEETGNLVNKGVNFITLGVVSLYRGNMEKAREFFESAEMIFERIGDRFHLDIARVNLADIHQLTGKIERAVDYYKKIVETTKEYNPDLHAYTLVRLGESCYYMEEPGEAEKYFTQASGMEGDHRLDSLQYLLRIKTERGEEDEELVQLLNQRPSMVEIEGRMKEALGFYHIMKKDFEKAEEIGRELFEMGEKIGNVEIKGRGLCLLLKISIAEFIEPVMEILDKLPLPLRLELLSTAGEFYLSCEDHTSAVSVADGILEEIEKKKYRRWRKKALMIKGKALLKMGNKKGLKYLEEAGKIVKTACARMENKEGYARVHMDIFRTLLEYALSRDNLPLAIEYFKILPSPLQKPLLEELSKTYPSAKKLLPLALTAEE